MGVKVRQLSVLLAARIVEPLSYTILFPFVNRMVEDILPNVPKSSVGKYSGIIESIFAFSSVLFMYQWGRLSDRIGRKPVILAGLCGLGFSLCMLGLSKSFWWALGARALCGALCGNASVMRAVLGDITPKKDEGWVYPLWTIGWDLSCVIGPALGALLQNPASQYPSSWIGQIKFLEKYPYFLPCAFISALSFLSFFLVLFCLEERYLPTLSTRQPRCTASSSFLPSPRSAKCSSPSSVRPSPLPKPSLTFITVITLTAMSFDAGFVLFTYSPIPLGGIALSPSSIALCLSIKGFISIAFSLLLFPLAQRRFGMRPLYRLFAACWVGIFAIPPLMNVLAAGNESGAWVENGTLKGLWFLMGPLVILYVFGDLCFPLNMMALNAAAPSPSSLGALNGISLIVSALARTMGPATFGQVFSDLS
ncbi:hypothetical protein L198_04430 [Cryptococcus wingfieldii CBS 7118]|uniref:Major facilitator superfamily (MFS) profile domain-containing protein n=1 Tax=Cryptococcus wingfieldii CBS 7118 TaxID=1295528 RepID=A0A1E3J4N7_9TREE|nr:hypothetical protein L198_04430 [Cryptococcus wingfieldii CBS 7118]ODN95812.1 hypothetical protein L198_04430 [Cryptococcus wingfieldii CBS 7118]